MDSSDIIYIDSDSRKPKYKQIIDTLLNSISKGQLCIGDRIPSINELSVQWLLSRDTVEKAYSELKRQRIIVSVKGKGYYVAKTDFAHKINVLFLVNKASTYKTQIYNSFAETLGRNAMIDFFVYHCDPTIFKSIITQRVDRYDYYVMMPHFKDEDNNHVGCSEEILATIKTLPENKLILLDRILESVSATVGKIHQDFVNDIFEALNIGIDKIKKYKKLILVYPKKAIYPYPKGIVDGFKKFCLVNDFEFEVLDQIYDSMDLHSKDLYITIEENDLVNLVRQLRKRHYEIGEEIGVISYNDTPLKELLGITVISTDFQKMGSMAAEMILKGKMAVIKNDFNFIDRQSV